MVRETEEHQSNFFGGADFVQIRYKWGLDYGVLYCIRFQAVRIGRCAYLSNWLHYMKCLLAPSSGCFQSTKSTYNDGF
jgi:hypothetical protein